MVCLTDEQLAQLALRLADGDTLSPHVEECEACRARLESMRALTTQLSATHAEVEHGHAAARAQLLAQLEREPVPTRRGSVWKRLSLNPGGLTTGQRIAVGGIGLSTAALVMLVLI